MRSIKSNIYRNSPSFHNVITYIYLCSTESESYLSPIGNKWVVFRNKIWGRAFETSPQQVRKEDTQET